MSVAGQLRLGKEPHFRRARGVSRSLRESEANSRVRNPFRSDYSGKPPPTAARQVKRERLGHWDEARSRNRENLIRRILWMQVTCNWRDITLQSADA